MHVSHFPQDIDPELFQDNTLDVVAFVLTTEWMIAWTGLRGH